MIMLWRSGESGGSVETSLTAILKLCAMVNNKS